MKKKKLVIFFAVLLIAAGVIAGVLAKNKNTLAVNYREFTVKKSDLNVTILSTGVVQPENRLEIKPPIAGRIETVLVDEGQKVKKGQILAWMSSTERAALLDAARSKGPEEVKKWEELYQPTPILAPISGSIILRSVEAGQTFTNTDSVFVMSDRLTIKAQVDETDIGQIKLKQSAKAVLDAYPNQSIDATVDKIAYDAKTVSNVTTYTVDVLPLETPKHIGSGMTANVTFLTAAKEGVLVIPSSSLRVTDNKFSVLVKPSNDAQPIEREVKIGISDGKRTEVIEGVNEGDIVLSTEIKSFSKGNGTSGANPFSPMGSRRGGGH